MTRDLRLLYGYRIVSRLYFHLPVLFVFLLFEHYTIISAEVLLAVYGLAVTGGSMIVPRLQGMRRKWLIVGGEILKCGGLALVVLGSDAWLTGVGQAVNGLGYAVAQGTDAGLLAAVAPNEDASVRAQSHTQSYMFLSVLVAGVAGAIMFYHDHQVVFYASIGAALLSAGIVAAVQEPARSPAPTTTAAGPDTTTAALPRRGEEGWWVRYYVLLRATGLAVFVGVLPWLFLRILAVSLAWFGVVLGVFSLSAFIGARYAVALTRRVGKPAVIGATLVLSACSLMTFATEPPLGIALAAMVVFGLSNGGVRPLTMSSLGPRRGELVPAMERAFGVVNAGILVGVGIILNGSSFRTLMMALTLAYVSAMAVTLIRPSKIVAWHHQHAEAVNR
jgi:predicted MFS family arabinose efflux permease